MVTSISQFNQLQQLEEPREVLLGDNSVIYAYGIGKGLLNTGISMILNSATRYTYRILDAT